MNKLISISIALVCVFAVSAASQASLIDANVVKGKPTLSAGFSLLSGFGLVTTGNFPIDNRMSVGGSFGYSFEGASSYLADMHMNLQFIEPTSRSPISMSLVGGLWGGTSSGLWLARNSRDFYIQPELGLCVSYPFDSRLTGRMNLVYGPSLGVEIGYKFTPAFEGVFAISEQVVGIKFKI